MTIAGKQEECVTRIDMFVFVGIGGLRICDCVCICIFVCVCDSVYVSVFLNVLCV